MNTNFVVEQEEGEAVDRPDGSGGERQAAAAESRGLAPLAQNGRGRLRLLRGLLLRLPVAGVSALLNVSYTGNIGFCDY